MKKTEIFMQIVLELLQINSLRNLSISKIFITANNRELGSQNRIVHVLPL